MPARKKPTHRITQLFPSNHGGYIRSTWMIYPITPDRGAFHAVMPGCLEHKTMCHCKANLKVRHVAEAVDTEIIETRPIIVDHVAWPGLEFDHAWEAVEAHRMDLDTVDPRTTRPSLFA